MRLFLLLILFSCAHVPKSRLVILDHKYFQVHYDPKLRLARYVEYTLLRENLLHKAGKRKNKFIPDPILVQSNLPFVTTKEYTKTGFDRGHLAPSADFTFSQEANDLTFVMSNMAPQTKLLNRGVWKNLEEQVRFWACGEKKLTVITGPIFGPSDKTLPSGLTIPQRFFKIIIDETPPRKTIAFIHHQKDPKTTMPYREFPVSEVERQAQITFPHSFPPEKGDWKSEDCLPDSRRK
ncbi:MAG: DNA/RNA non-specific endonuclease [Bdellovibrionota bacterium]